MSFGIYLYRQDPQGLVEADRDAVRAVLARWGWDGSPGSPYRVATPDGVSAEFYAAGLDGSEPFLGGNLEIRGFSLGLCRLILELARAGPFFITHDGDPGAVILAGEGQRASLPAEMTNDPKLVVCDTPEELEAAIQRGFDEWRAFRDRVGGP